jgi:serine/threonine protein kinase
MSTGIQTSGVELPGYVLAERIGSGGYAEVWRAEAPGGIDKAVKIVHGYYDDEFASQELKALERIKGVRHPFLLSLERFEVVNGRLAILTELADMSLEQRLRQCRADGLAGIPRDELLRYMIDAAEALDFLSQKHNLLHLDIKPENLLVLGDHIKVADFGLVKELASRTQNSLVSGMTPTYASPEMFDDEPSAYSDQYSLAIVYQEMLVGTLPFPGRTAAQLAKQHTQAEPQLMALPAEDRPVVAQALAKDPAERFPSCRAFVDALLHRAQTPPELPPTHPSQPRPVAPPSPSGPDDTKPSSIRTTVRRANDLPIEPRDTTATQPIGRGVRELDGPIGKAATPIKPAAEETVDVAVPVVHAEMGRERPTLFVGLGGLGIQVLCRLRALSAVCDTAGGGADAGEMLAFDTDRDELREACSSRWKSPLSPDDTLHLPLRLPKNYDNARDILGWVSRRWLYNIPRSLETRGYRPLGRVALVDHSQRVLELLDQRLSKLGSLVSTPVSDGGQRDECVRIVLVAGMGGGTGAGMVLDVANAAKAIATARGLQAEIQGILICTCFASATSSPLVAANTYSLLTELNHATQYGNEGATGNSEWVNSFETRDAPFDTVYCIPVRSRKAESQDDVLNSVAKYLALEAVPELRAAVRSCRAVPTPREQSLSGSLVLKKFGCASLSDRTRELLSDLTASLADAIKQYWSTADKSADWVRLVRIDQQAASVARLETPAEGDDDSRPEVVPYNDATPLALRGRFNEHLSLQFATETIAQIQLRIETRDGRGRPRLLPSDAKSIVDTAVAVVSSLVAAREGQADVDSQFAASPILSRLIAEGSRRVLSHVVDQFDPKAPDRRLARDTIDELLLGECRLLLEESLSQAEMGQALTAIMPTEQAVAAAIEHATTDLLQCGCDRRTLLVTPQGRATDAAAQALLAAKPLAAVVPADVDDAVLVSEDSGISPRSLALGLEWVYPGISDAARRLHTRIDVEWTSLL